MTILVGILIAVCGLLLGAVLVMAFLIWFSAKLAQDPDFDSDAPFLERERELERQDELEEWG